MQLRPSWNTTFISGCKFGSTSSILTFGSTYMQICYSSRGIGSEHVTGCFPIETIFN